MLRQAVAFDKGQFIPVASLKGNLAVYDMEKSATAQAFWVAPFEDSPLAILKEVFWNANHFGHLEGGDEHLANGFAARYRAFGDLMVDCIGLVKRSQGINVPAIECFDPSLYNVTRPHRAI